MLKSKLALSKKKITILAATALCVVLITSSALYLFPGQVAQAAIINPHPGLVGWWSFDEGTGTVASESSGNGNTGTINGATWGDGKYGKALNFDVSTSYVSVADSASLAFGNTAFSISMWVKKSSSGNGYGDLIGKYSAADSGRWGFSFRDTTHIQFYSASSSVITVPNNDNSWCQYVFVVEQSTLSLYVNGLLITSVPLSAIAYTNTQPLTICKYSGSPQWGNLNAIVDEVQIYNRALSQAEIQANLNSDPNLSANVLAKIPKGTTQIITTISWQGTGNIDVTVTSPSQEYTENMLPMYQKSSYSTSNGITSLMNIKRLSVSVTALPSDQNWYMALSLDKVNDYQITVEVQK
jgi:hypothetical protein